MCGVLTPALHTFRAPIPSLRRLNSTSSASVVQRISLSTERSPEESVDMSTWYPTLCRIFSHNGLKAVEKPESVVVPTCKTHPVTRRGICAKQCKKLLTDLLFRGFFTHTHTHFLRNKSAALPLPRATAHKTECAITPGSPWLVFLPTKTKMTSIHWSPVSSWSTDEHTT